MSTHATLAALDFTPELDCATAHPTRTPATHNLEMCCPDCGARWGYILCQWCAICYSRHTFACPNHHVHTFQQVCKHRCQIGVTP